MERKEFLFLVKVRFIGNDGSNLHRGMTLIQGFGSDLESAAKEARKEFDLPEDYELLYYRG